ncbi:MAG TPA: bacterial transcriptional activator domain-containing protein [Microthrixaceae bacterium]|nr:bacterial transcriptional activator domain-containing protein [Microthrixaceae bacterium]
MLGQPTVRLDGAHPVPVPASLQPFLAFLTLQRDTGCHKDHIIHCLWPDLASDAGRRRLNTVVWRSRKLFGANRGEAIVSTRSGHFALDQEVVSIDVAPVLGALSDAGRSSAERGDATALEALSRAVHVDVGHFLTGNYDEWVVQARHQLEGAVTCGVEILLDAASEPNEAIGWAKLLVGLDPLREDAHRRLIRLYADAGRRADALRQYDSCVRHLHEELGAEPLIETTLVATAVREGIDLPPANPADPRQALVELRDALASCQVAVDRIESALASLLSD